MPIPLTIKQKKLLFFSDRGISFDERYDFNEDNAAPLSSPYTEGNGSLTLVQNDGDFATDSGSLVNTVQTTPAWGDLGAYTIAYTRESGRSLIAVLNLSTWEEMGVGFNAAAAPGNLTAIEHSIYAQTTDGQFATETIGNIFDSLSLNTDYRVIIMLRATGAWLLLDDGNTWQLIDVSDTGASTPLYQVYSILDGVGKLNTLRTDIIKSALRPNVVLSDNFSDTSAPFLSDGLGHLEADGVGAGLTRNGTDWSSASNRRSNDDTGGSTLITDGDMETGGVDDWTANNSATLTKEVGDPHGGTQSLRIARNGVNNPGANQGADLTIGKWYRAQGWAKSDGNAVPALADGGAIHWTGTTSTSYQVFNVVFRALNVLFQPQSNTTTGAEFTEWDDLTISELAIADMLDLVETSTPDVVFRVDLTITDDTPGGIAVAWDSVSSPQNGLIVYVDRALNKIRVDKYLAGAFSANLVDQAITYGAANIMEVHLSDADTDGTYILRTYYNRGNKSETTFSDADIIGNTVHGLFGLTDGGFAENENVWAKDLGTQYDKYFVGA